MRGPPRTLMSRWGRSIVASCALLLCAPVGARAAEPGGPTAPGSQPVTRVLVRFASGCFAGAAGRHARPRRRPARRDARRARGSSSSTPSRGSASAPRSPTSSAWTACSTPSPTASCTRPPRRTTRCSSDEWGLSAIRAPEAWDVTTGSAQVTVAVVDTGIDATHPDLSRQPVDEPRRVGWRARGQRARRRRQRAHRRRARLGLRRPGRTAPGRQRPRHPRLGHHRGARR